MLQTEPEKIGVRDFQHNFSKHYITAKHRPIVVTKYGKEQLVVADSETYRLVKKGKPKNKLTADMEFFGMYKNRKGWKGKSAARIARDLRKAAWYGTKTPY